MTGHSRNKLYEDRQRKKGLKKITIWIPEETEVDFKLIADYCCRNKDRTPFMVRNLATGRMEKGV